MILLPEHSGNVAKERFMSSRFRKILGTGVLSASLTLMTAGAALAAPAASAAAACKTNGELIYTASLRIPPQTGHGAYYAVQLWYSPTCRYVWAVDAASQSGDSFWVYNENTAATASASYPSTATAAINDANTESHACLDNVSKGLTYAGRICTGYF